MGQWRKRYRHDLTSVPKPTIRVSGVLKTVLKPMFTQMTEASAQPSKKLDSFRIMAIKETV